MSHKSNKLTSDDLFFIYQILFRVCLTLIIGHKSEILAAEDIAALANLFRAIVKDEKATDCHTFMESIFRVPGKLTRKEIEAKRASALAAENSGYRLKNSTI